MLSGICCHSSGNNTFFRNFIISRLFVIVAQVMSWCFQIVIFVYCTCIVSIIVGHLLL